MTILSPIRPIRSFVRRQARMTPSQQRALNDLGEQHCLVAPLVGEYFQWENIFKREAPRILEIGFGMGETFVQMAKLSPHLDFIGIEVHQPGVGKCLSLIHENALTNIKIISLDAFIVLREMIQPGSIDKILLFFPDPWPKQKHHKRRLVQTPFCDLVANALKPNGQFHLATDWQPYADHMSMVLENHQRFKKSTLPIERLQTKFERRGIKLGHSIFDLVFLKDEPEIA